jgi:hypothetical protein
MATLAISLLWFLIFVIVLAGVVWLVIYGINTFVMQIPAIVERGIWFVVLLIVLIALIGTLTGTGPQHYFR